MENVLHGMSMLAIRSNVKASLQAPVASGINYDVVPFSLKEGQRDWNIQANLNAKNFQGNMLTRVQLPGDPGYTFARPKAPLYGGLTDQKKRDVEQRRQLAMPWKNRFMPYNAAERLNNPAQASFVRQPQLTAPNVYGQFYAFMHAMSAAFGTLQTRS